MTNVYFTFEPREDLRHDVEQAFPEVTFHFHIGINEAYLKEAEIIVTYGEDLKHEHIELANKLEWIFVASAGVEKMPAEAIVAKNIYVSNVKGIHKKPMTESILAHILAYKRALPHVYEKQKSKQWDKKARLSELNGSTALIIGPGAIGAEIGRILQAFDVKTIGCNRSGSLIKEMNETYKIDQLLQHLPKADIVISMLPSTEETTYLLKAEHFKAMKNTAMFMNFGRGNLVEEQILVDALKNKDIEHAVLDVYEVEPLPKTSELWTLENITLSPHFSSHSSRYVERSLEIFKPSLASWLQGERKLVNEIDLTKGY
jgi:phosphoglycerate dehydrogenase-like enzyme